MPIERINIDCIQDEIEKVAQAISLVLDIDVTIVNDDMVRIAGTGVYKDKLGQKIEGMSAFKKSYREKKTLIIDNPKVSDLCRDCYRLGNCMEEAEVCCPIILDNQCYGVIGLIAFDQVQKTKLLSSRDELIQFIEKMADLISGNIRAEIKSSEYNIEREKIAQVLNSIDRPVVSLDEMARIDSFNYKFSKMFSVGPDVQGRSIKETLEFFDLETLFDFKKSDRNSDKFYYEYKAYRGIYSIAKIRYGGVVSGYVIDFIDNKEAIQTYNRMNVDHRMTIDDIIGKSRAIMDVKRDALNAAKSTSTILITGQSGTGKEMFARATHSHSDRSDGPFVTINCAAIPGELLESELFGYDEGAFTGAKKGGKLGLFEIANKGTIFLDEIGDMSLHLQAKLLRVLQEKEIHKVGGGKNIKVDVRIISATNKNLADMVAEGMFREDLYYRLNVIPISIPSLEERKDDIPLLVDRMIDVYSHNLGKEVRSVSDRVIAALKEYSWPGNIRELQNVIEYSINMTNGSIIDDVNLVYSRFRKIGPQVMEKTRVASQGEGQDIEIRTIESLEEDQIRKALRKYKDYKKDKDLAAKALGISRATLYRKMDKYSIEVD